MKFQVLAILILPALGLRAQEDDFRQVLASVLFNNDVYQRVFFKYEGDSGVTFLNGYKKGLMCTFILPDSNIRKYQPNVSDVIGTAHAYENQFLTMTLLSHPEGRVFVTSNILDVGIELFVDFDRLEILRRTASLEFHTTSLHERKSMKQRYVRINCELKKGWKGWKVKRVKVEPFPCCTRLWG